MEQNDIRGQENQQAGPQKHRHSKIITGFHTLDGNVHWFYNTRNIREDEDENVEVRFFILMRDTPAPQKGQALSLLLKSMESANVSWIVPDRKEWAFDLDQMKTEFEGLAKLDWFNGRAYLEPEFEVKKEDLDISNKRYYETHIVFYLNPKLLGVKPLYNPPEIQHSLREFRLDHPDPKKV